MPQISQIVYVQYIRYHNCNFYIWLKFLASCFNSDKVIAVKSSSSVMSSKSLDIVFCVAGLMAFLFTPENLGAIETLLRGEGGNGTCTLVNY